MQTSKTDHVVLDPEFLRYTNHSCSPNVFFDLSGRQLVALKHIPANSEILFFYPSTEWSMEEPFECNCGSARCKGSIQGAKFLPKEVVEEYRVADHIRVLKEEQSGQQRREEEEGGGGERELSAV